MWIGLPSFSSATKSSDVSAWSSSGCVSSVSRLTISKPRAHATHSFVLRKCIELHFSVGM